jgi:hypothetical protein
MRHTISKVTPDLLHESNLAHIRSKEVRIAYLFLIRVAQGLPGYDCYPAMKGLVRDFRYFTGDEQPFAFIVNTESLLFYFRKPSLTRFSLDRIEDVFDDVRQPRTSEITVRVNDLNTAELLMWLIFGFVNA